MTARPIHAGLRAVLEFGPTVGFVIAYLVFRNDAVVVAGTQYSGLVMVLAAFLPIFALAIGVLWFLTRRIARLQVATAVLVLVFGGLSVWLNDLVFFKMKPTAIYLTLALILGVGLVRGQSWLSYIMEDMIPLRPAGWMLLTKRWWRCLCCLRPRTSWCGARSRRAFG
jgi:intracellular septation protein